MSQISVKSNKLTKTPSSTSSSSSAAAMEEATATTSNTKKFKRAIAKDSDNDSDSSIDILPPKPKKSKQVSDNEDDPGLEDAENVPPKKPKEKEVTKNDSLEIVFDNTDAEPSSKPKKAKKEDDKIPKAAKPDDILPPKPKKSKQVSDNEDDPGLEDAENLPPTKPKKKEVTKNDSLEIVFDNTDAKPSSKPKKAKKEDDKIPKAKKEDNKIPKVAKHDDVLPSKPKKSKQVSDNDDESGLEDTEDLPPTKPKKPKKKEVIKSGSFEILFDKTDPGPSSKPKKAKKEDDKIPKAAKPDNTSPQKPVKKKKELPPSATKSTQQSIFQFCTTVQPPAASTVNEKEKAEEYYEDAIKALKKGQHFSFKQAVLAAQKLSESAIEDIESECFKFAVLKNRKNNIDYDENENFQRYEEMLSKFYKSICEDTTIANIKPFPDLRNAVETSEYSNLFGSCLSISQFFVSYPVYLKTTLKFSAEDLLNAVASGVEGYYKLTAEILAVFMQAFSQYEWFKGYKFFSAHLDNEKKIPIDKYSASEICKLFLLKDVSPLTREVSHAVDGKLYDYIKGNKNELLKKLEQNEVIPRLDEELAKAFVDKEFFELNPKQQIAIFENLMGLFMSDYFFGKQFDPEECKIIPKDKVNAMKKELHDLIAKNQAMSRSEKRKEREDKKPDQQYVRQKRKLETLIRNAERRYKLADLHQALKPLPLTLGFDRYHRRYYIFQNSPNRGIYIEEFCHLSLDERSEFEDDPIAFELERYTTESGRISLPFSLWYRVSTAEQFDEIKQILCKRGVRENQLLEAIQQNEIAISSTFIAPTNPRDLKFAENESVLRFLKDAMAKVLDKAEKYSLIHFTKKHEELVESVEAAKSFDELRDTIVSITPFILPCAFEPFAAGVKMFRITAWIKFAELCQSYSQMHTLLNLLLESIRTDKLFGARQCPRCDVRFDRVDARSRSKPKIIACQFCYGYIHFKCHDEVTEIDPSPSEASWICENCKGLDKNEEEKGDETDEDEAKDILETLPEKIVGTKTLRARKPREKVESSSEASSSRPSSRNSVWENETTRSLRPRRQAVDYS